MLLACGGLVVILEVVQLWIPHRTSDVADILCGWLGISLAAFLAGNVRPRRFRNPTLPTDRRIASGAGPMKITVWGINYAPEVAGIGPCNAALCEFLKSRGDDVRMITSFAYYPAWRKSPVDRRRLYRTDQVNGVKVHRCWHYVPSEPRVFRRMLHEASFVASSFLRLLTLPRPDIYVVVSPPLLLGFAAWLLSVVKGAPFLFHVQDLQPDAALGLGMVKPGALASGLLRLEALAYRKAAKVSGISRGMLSAFERKGVPREKILLFPNGVSLPAADQLPPRGRFRARARVPANSFVALYSGNIGVKQGLEVLIDAARLLRDHRIHLVICGDGVHRANLAARVTGYQLRNVTMLPLQPEKHYREMLVDADLSIITQQRGAGAHFFPSKLLSNLAHARPILAVADSGSELGAALDKGGFGVRVDPDAPAAVATALERLAGSPLYLGQLGKAGRRYVEQFEMNHVLPRFAEQLEAVLGRKNLG